MSDVDAKTVQRIEDLLGPEVMAEVQTFERVVGEDGSAFAVAVIPRLVRGSVPSSVRSEVDFLVFREEGDSVRPASGAEIELVARRYNGPGQVVETFPPRP